MAVADNDITLAVAALDVPADIDRTTLRIAVTGVMREAEYAAARGWGDGGFLTMHLDSTGHYGYGDAASCEDWPSDRSGVTFDLSIGAVQGRDIDATPAEYVAAAVLAALEEAVETDAIQEMAEYDNAPETQHEWQIARFTGNKTCARCGLLPLDDDDALSECPGRRE